MPHQNNTTSELRLHLTVTTRFPYGRTLGPQLVARWAPSRYIWGPKALHPVALNRRRPFFNHKVQESVFLCVEVWGLL